MILEYTKEEIKNYLISNKIVLDNGCWILSSRNTETYQYYLGIGIHRLSAWIFNDFDIDSKSLILHKCDNPPCWNPEHLNSGDQSDNRTDSINKGRSNRLFGRVLDQINTTHCPKGHEYTEENTYKHNGKRSCKECRRILDRKRRPKKGR